MAFNLLELIELGLFGVGIMITAVGMHHQGRHLEAVPRIATAEEFEAFKRFVRWQMYLTIALLVCVGPAILLIWFEDGDPTFLERVVLWAPCVVIGLSTFYTKTKEKEIRDSSRVAPEFATEFEDVCYAWRKKLLPNF